MVTTDASYWASGFLPGAEWLMYEATGEARWLQMARAREAAIAPQAGIAESAASFHHIAVTKSGSAVKLYVEGVDRTGPVVNRTIANSADALLIGQGTGFFNGTLDEVAIYNRALTATAIAAHRAAAG